MFAAWRMPTRREFLTKRAGIPPSSELRSARPSIFRSAIVESFACLNQDITVAFIDVVDHMDVENSATKQNPVTCCELRICPFRPVDDANLMADLHVDCLGGQQLSARKLADGSFGRKDRSPLRRWCAQGAKARIWRLRLNMHQVPPIPAARHG